LENLDDDDDDDDDSDMDINNALESIRVNIKALATEGPSCHETKNHTSYQQR
jgi:hypothetical protein